jgi:hypothetical protein
MIKRLLVVVLIISLFCNCLVMKIDKDSEPVFDFGTPLVGHFNNGDYGKGVLYTVLLVTGIVGMILFAPSSEGGVIPQLDRQIADPLFYSFLGFSCSVPVASSIDTAVTYHMVNKKIIELNDLNWDPRLKVKKYDVILDYRKEMQQEFDEKVESNREDNYAEELEYYRQRLLDGTITEDELILVERADYFRERLQNEIGYYYINRQKEDR